VLFQHYRKWSGFASAILSENNPRTHKSLHLFLEWNQEGQYFSHYYRIYSDTPFPDELDFGYGIRLYANHAIGYFSDKIEVPFNPNLVLTDQQVNWKVRYSPSGDNGICLFPDERVDYISGYHFQHLDPSSGQKIPHYFLVPNGEIADRLKQCLGNPKQNNFNGKGLDGYLLFYYPLNSERWERIREEFFPSFPKSDSMIDFEGGLNVGYRRYLNMSEIYPEIIASGSTENVIPTTEPSIVLTRVVVNDPFGNEVLTDRYRLPDHIPNGTYTVSYDGKTKTLHLLSPSIADGLAPKRNHFGLITHDNNLASGYHGIFPLDDYITHSNATLQAPNATPFFPHQPFGINNGLFIQNQNNTYPHLNDWLLHYISTKGTVGLVEFDALLRYINSIWDIHTENEKNSLRRRILNRLEWNGYVDANYDENKIHILPPTLVCLPTTMGVLAMIVGARTPELLNRIIQGCNQNENLSWYYQKSEDVAFPNFPLPNVIYVRSHPNGQFNQLARLAQEVGMIFKRYPNNIPVLPQLATLSTIPSVDDYLTSILQNEPSLVNFGDWNRHKMFNANSLWAQKATQDLIDELQFVPADDELRNHYYHLQPRFIEAKFGYSDYFYIRLKGEYYNTDKHWGRLIAVKFHLLNGNILKPFRYHAETLSLLVLATIAFPVPITRALVMMSGELPQIQVIEGRKFNVFKNVPSTFAHNLLLRLFGRNYLQYS